MLDLETKEDTRAVEFTEGVHILDGEKNPVTDGIDIWTVLCGEQCIAWPDIEGDDDGLTPEGFDFYLLGHGHAAASCKACRALAGVKSR